MRMLEERRKLLKDGEVELEVQKRELSEEQSKLKVEQSNLELEQMKLQGIEEDIAQRRLEIDDCRKDIETKQAKLEKETKAMQKTKDETEILLESLRKLLGQRKINQRKPTTQDMVDTHKSTWYTRRGETKEILSLIHVVECGHSRTKHAVNLSRAVIIIRDLEVFHNMLLKYTPKRLHFWYMSMMGRMKLAVLDHKYNVDREQATTKEGT
ncbi:hypothetical protein Bbelb_272230 [Branchiostoma belcheri]|nr:hypothetical protein Bbelb_272230 [Branchiostoma belcheri]